jgi:hypothetical protein
VIGDRKAMGLSGYRIGLSAIGPKSANRGAVGDQDESAIGARPSMVLRSPIRDRPAPIGRVDEHFEGPVDDADRAIIDGSSIADPRSPRADRPRR